MAGAQLVHVLHHVKHAAARRCTVRAMCSNANFVDVAILGAGTAGLAVAGLLQKNGGSTLRCLVLDDNTSPGGSWQHRWESLKLFSTRKWSSLPLMTMTGEADGYPDTHEMASYLAKYEKQMGLTVDRPVNVVSVEKEPDNLLITSSSNRRWRARAVVACTGGNHTPLTPSVPGADAFEGIQIHSSSYKNPEPFAGKKVVVVGEGNSGAQILAEVSRAAEQVLWVTSKEPEFLPKTMSGKDVFDVSAKAILSAKKNASQSSTAASAQTMIAAIPSLKKIIYVDPVREAAERGAFDTHRRPFSHFTPSGICWDDGSTWEADAVIWCTGYGHDTAMLRPLGLLDHRGRAHVKGTRSCMEPRLWMVGYGHWTGVASGSIPGAAWTAPATAAEILSFLRSDDGRT